MSAVLLFPHVPPRPSSPGHDRVLVIALIVSVVVHALLLSVRFAFPEKFAEKIAPQLEVVLVNSKTKSRPQQAHVLAQANLDGGGNTDADRKAKTPLPALRDSVASNAAMQLQRQRMKELEREQKQMLTQLKPAPVSVAAPAAPAEPDPPVQPTPEAELQVDGQDLAARSIALARLEAQIARRLEEYEKRPRRTFVGARAAEARFAEYVDAFREKVERFGSNNYPNDARGRVYGSLRLTVSIRADGSLESVEVDRPSGHRILDDAARQIVKMAGPFGVFPPDMKRDTDIIVITRTWFFEPGDTLRSE